MVKTPDPKGTPAPGVNGEQPKAKGGFKPQADSKRAIIQGVLASNPAGGFELGELIGKCQEKKALSGDHKKSWRRAIRKAGKIRKMVFPKPVVKAE